MSKRRWKDRTKTPRSRLWGRRAPPVERRHKLWKLRNRLRLSLFLAPFQSPWLPGVRRPHVKREIHFVRETEW